ncbi:MAG: SLC13 family permease [Gammaproteobacteria bacterium]|nr:SLC13 family permease [Gammaproteobacteria bacterium]
MTEPLSLTVEMIAVIGILILTIFLFVSEVLRVDVVAVMIMVLIGLTSLLPGYDGLVPAIDLFDGFSSNAVISIMAVMILGAGLDRTGIMNRLAGKILHFAGNTERRIMVLVSTAVGTISGFMQNIGAAALFLPVVDRICKRSGVTPSGLLMPMGYCAILGGTLTMVGSSPLILLNDLIENSNESLPAHVRELDTFSLFSVTPIGIALLILGVIYFFLFGKKLLPKGTTKALGTGAVTSYILDVYGISGQVFEMTVTNKTTIVGKTIGELEDEGGYEERIIAIRSEGKVIVEPDRSTEIVANSDIAVMGRYERIVKIAAKMNLKLRDEIRVFQETFNPTASGIAEVVVPPYSAAIGKTISDLGCRRNFHVTMLALYRDDKPIRDELIDLPIQAGDTMVVHSLWRHLQHFIDSLQLVAATDFPKENERPEKIYFAVGIFIFTLCLVLFTDLRLSAALLTGALLMIVSRVITIEEAYRAIGWQSVFLLASLIPLGIAVEKTGTATWIAQQFVGLLDGVPSIVFLFAFGILATVFTLVMSNVGATVLLVPIAINVAFEIGSNPSVFALTVALATSNSFLIPTHQVNALIQVPGGYRVADFMRAGLAMTVLFLVVVIAMVHFFYHA